MPLTTLSDNAQLALPSVSLSVCLYPRTVLLSGWYLTASTFDDLLKDEIWKVRETDFLGARPKSTKHQFPYFQRRYIYCLLRRLTNGQRKQPAVVRNVSSVRSYFLAFLSANGNANALFKAAVKASWYFLSSFPSLVTGMSVWDMRPDSHASRLHYDNFWVVLFSAFLGAQFRNVSFLVSIHNLPLYRGSSWDGETIEV